MSAPVGHTCPDIDKAIKRLNNAIKELVYLQKELPDHQRDLSNIEDECLYAIDAFEDLRKDNDALRTWGKEMEQESESKDDYISELENKLNDHKNAA